MSDAQPPDETPVGAIPVLPPAKQVYGLGGWWGELKSRTKLVVLLAPIVAVVVLALLPSSPAKIDRYDAAAACETFVERGLKSPGSAEWNGPHEYTGSGDGPWIVQGSVDSQNGFGAMLRTFYVCTVTHDAKAKTWTLDNLETF